MGNYLLSQLTFENNDVFNRKPFVESIMKLISEWGGDIFTDKDALSISIDSAWGTGKSSLIGMWYNYIKSTAKYSRYRVAYYNAWQNNYFNDAFRPLVYELQGIGDETEAEAFRKQCLAFSIALREGTCSGANTPLAKGTTDCSGYFNSFRRINQVSDEFGKALRRLAPDNGKLIVFVDELDRCRPDFAVSTLELIRHYMSVPDVIFIFTLDLEQLIHLVKTIYGFDTDAWGYLRRFFNISFKMPAPDIKKYVSNLLYMSISDSDALKEVNFSKHMTEMFNYFGLPIRDVEKITTNFIIFYAMNKVCEDPLKPGLFLRLMAYLYFMIVKYKYPVVYRGILNRGGYHIEGDLVEGGYVLQRRYCALGEVKDMLRSLQGNKFWDEDLGPNYIAEYLIPEIAPDAKSVGNHIDRALELFAEVG
jgi:hypothetical protein